MNQADPQPNVPNPSNGPASDPASSEPHGFPGRSSQPVQETVLFEGNAAWIGRFTHFFLWFLFAGILLFVPIALQVWGSSLNAPWWISAGCILLAIVLVLTQVAFHKSIRFRITNYRIDYERGMLTRRIDSLELWHVDDLHFKQTLFERLVGVGSIEVSCREHAELHMLIVSIPNARQVFEAVKTAILNAKRQRGILEIDQ